jgi:predicted DNA-binding transcriptional regulator AlpA
MVTDVPKHLMGAREIEDRLGVSRQRVTVLTRRADWPEPYDTLAMGKVWRVEDVEAWIAKHRPDLARNPAPE